MKPADICIAVMVAVIRGLALVASRIALDEFLPSLKRPQILSNVA